jgi:hypothetical protein
MVQPGRFVDIANCKSTPASCHESSFEKPNRAIFRVGRYRYLDFEQDLVVIPFAGAHDNGAAAALFLIPWYNAFSTSGCKINRIVCSKPLRLLQS